MKYFQCLDNANNKKFVAAFKKMYGEKSVIGDVTQAAYLGPWLWKAAVEKAGSFDVDKVVGGVARHRAQERAGRLREDPREPSPLEKSRIGKAKADGQFEGGLRVRRSDRAQSVPQGLPVRRLR